MLILAWQGTYSVNPGEVGVVRTFGKETGQTQPGLHFRVPIAQQVDIVDLAKIRQAEIGFRSVADGASKRVDSEALMLTGDENIIEAQMIVQYQVQDPSKYLFRLADPEKTLHIAAEIALRGVGQGLLLPLMMVLSSRAVGGDLQGRERSIAVVAPNNLEYQQCVATGLQVIRDAGNEIDLELEYVLDFANVAAQAPSVLAKLKDNDITSVACYCDPLMVLSLAGQASEQNYYPEWLIGGVGFVDIDLVGQFIAASAPDQWRNAFGGSPSTPQAAAGTSEAYRAYKSVRDDEPSLFVDVVYAQILPLVIGVQMAGPDLTPENLETGMFAYPEATGMAGTWDWSPGHYSPVVDMREVWYDPAAPAPMNGTPGSYVDNGQRYRIGEIPEGDPEVFK